MHPKGHVRIPRSIILWNEKNNQNNYNFTEELSDSQFCRLKTERKKFRLILFLSNIENPLYRTMQLQWPSFLVHENNLIQLIKSPMSLYMRLFLNPLPPDISIQTLHTIHYAFPKVLTKRICLIITSCFSWWSFPLFSWPWHFIQGWFC